MAGPGAKDGNGGPNLPPHGHPDRKRMLNVLAQRRYRQRKRQKIASLENVLNATQARLRRVTLHGQVGLPSPSSSENIASPFSAPDDSSNESVEARNCGLDPTAVGAVESVNTGILVHHSTSVDDNTHVSHDADSSPSVIAPLPDDPFAVSLLPEFDLDASDIATDLIPQTLVWDDVSTNAINSTSNAMTFFSDAATLQPNQQYDFADDRVISLPLVACMRASLEIATMLDCVDQLWDPTALRVLTASTTQQLPPSLQPTAAQQYIPHHPLIDLLPWPNVRSKLCYVFSQPAEARPPTARSELGVVAMVWDIDDETEGLRVSGSTQFDSANWEIGQRVFRNWWWAFDREVVENSNRLRASRGAPLLRLEAP